MEVVAVAKRAAGVRLGRPPVLTAEVVHRIVGQREAGLTLRAIAEKLTADGVATARGKATWSTSSVQAALAGQGAATFATEEGVPGMTESLAERASAP